ncbi:hypothetical protein BDA99DRAFT_507847 [Phascolomyces articulosus]|uniref:F-box domain-containing protein n=1 Tax=Phascolomyces articulosus TaxID=60185 RepID=A0AAD5PEN5_9FUNG|nr:hypothetical protein BDA99DRAFT_507847 [Phascolomyces articulosus]
MPLESLPPELFYLIFLQLSFQDQWQCSLVCKNWRYILLQWPHLWTCISTVNFKTHDLREALSPFKDVIKQQYIRRVQLIVQDGSHLKSPINFLIEQGCTSIVEVDISIPCIEPSVYLNLVELSASSLTHLYFTCSLFAKSYKPLPEEIIQSFPNLKVFHYRGSVYKIRSWEPSMPVDFKHKHLTELGLYIQNNMDGTFAAKNILTVMPNLRRLYIDIQNVARRADLFIKTLNKHCHQLKGLVLKSFEHSTTYFLDDDDEEDTTKRTYMTSQNSTRLEHLVVHIPYLGFHQIHTTRILRMLLVQHHQTLHIININGHSTISGNHCINQLVPFEFPTMQHLTIHNNRTPNTKYLWREFLPGIEGLPRFFAQSLSTEKLVSFNLSGLHYTFDLSPLAIGAKNLQELHLVDCTRISTLSLTKFFDNLYISADAPILKKVTLVRIPTVTVQMLVSMVLVLRSCLQELVIDGCKQVSRDDIVWFLDHAVAQHHFSSAKLRKLKIDIHYIDNGHFANDDLHNQILEKLDLLSEKWQLILPHPNNNLFFANDGYDDQHIKIYSSTNYIKE